MIDSISGQNYYSYSASSIEQRTTAKSQNQIQDFQPVNGSKSANLKARELLPKECKT
jgi:hypothetical protein